VQKSLSGLERNLVRTHSKIGIWEC